MRLHIIEGESGCRYAVEHHATAVVVDALRASATAAALLASGVESLFVAAEVEAALSKKEQWPDALLYGERGGVPPEGFDFGNSPSEAGYARGRRVIFTTTTGAGRLVSAWGAPCVIMGSTVNADAVCACLMNSEPDEIVLIPAGLWGYPEFDAQEDWAAAVYLAQQIGAHADWNGIEWGHGESEFMQYSGRLKNEGLQQLFMTAPHADKLRAIGQSADILWCAGISRYNTVPGVVERDALGVLVGNLGGLPA